jgi:hypothetical protein
MGLLRCRARDLKVVINCPVFHSIFEVPEREEGFSKRDRHCWRAVGGHRRGRKREGLAATMRVEGGHRQTKERCRRCAGAGKLKSGVEGKQARSQLQ